MLAFQLLSCVENHSLRNHHRFCCPIVFFDRGLLAAATKEHGLHFRDIIAINEKHAKKITLAIEILCLYFAY